MTSPSAAAMHSTIWPEVEPEVELFLAAKLTERAEPAEGKKEGPRMFNMDMRDSASRIAGFLKDARLHAFVLAQNIMGFTEEAREAAIANQVAAASPAEAAPPGGEVVPGNFPKHGD